MYKPTILLLLLIALSFNVLKAQSANWAKPVSRHFGNSYSHYTIGADKAGNLYSFFRASDSSVYDGKEVYTGGGIVLKYHPDGSAAWFKSFTKNATVAAFDSIHNCFYMAGGFINTIRFPNGDSLVSNYNNNFLLKADTSGKILWIKMLASTGSSDVSVSAIAVNKAGNVYLTGRFSNTVTFSGGKSLKSSQGYNIYIAKFDDSGNLLQLKRDGGSYSYSSLGQGIYPQYMLVDQKNNVVINGYANYQNDTIAGTVLTVADRSMFIAKYDSSLNGVWAKQAVHNHYSQAGYQTIYGFTADKNCNYYYCCTIFADQVKWDNFQCSTTSYQPNGFLVKYNDSGAVQWVAQVGDDPASQNFPGLFTATSLTVDPGGNSYLSGTMTPYARFFGSNNTSLTMKTPAFGGENFYLTKFDKNGVPLFIYTDSASASGDGLLYSNGNIYICGSFETVSRFGKDKLIPHQNIISWDNLFLAGVSAKAVPGLWLQMDTFSGPLCAGSSFKVHYDTSSAVSYDNANYFIVQLSDASGSFDHATEIGRTLTGHPSNNITVTIPADLHTAAHYRIRVVSGIHEIISNDNGKDITIFGGRINSKSHVNICHGDSLVLTADSGVYYKWNTLATTKSIIVKKTGKYYYSNGSCAPIDTVSVTVLQPKVNFGADTIITQGDTLTLDAGAHKSYSWSTGDTSRMIKITQAGTYTATVTDSMGCTASYSIKVSIKTALTEVGEGMHCNVYPNPANDQLHLELKTTKASIIQLQLLDMQGHIILTDIMTSETTTAVQRNYSITGIPAGLYCFRISSASGVLNKMISVVR